MADSYNYDMQRLQQDAIRRAREMQARAQSSAPTLNIPAARPAPVQNRPAPPVVPPPPPVRHTPPQEQHVPSETPAPRHRDDPEQEPMKGLLSPIGDIFGSLMADSERTLILVLIILLVEDKADTGVIFALMYLIL